MSTPCDERTIVLASSLGRLDVSEGNAIGNDSVPVDNALVRRDVNTLGLSPHFEVSTRVKDGSREAEECRHESFKVGQHCFCGCPPSVS